MTFERTGLRRVRPAPRLKDVPALGPTHVLAIDLGDPWGQAVAIAQAWGGVDDVAPRRREAGEGARSLAGDVSRRGAFSESGR